MRSYVSGVAVNTLLFSRIGAPLFHRYCVVSRPGTHVTFRGSYMTRIRTFLKESDAASLRSRHRRRARAIASRMSQKTTRETHGQEPNSSEQRRPGSGVWKSAPAAAVAAASLTPVVVRSLRSGPRAIPALMDLVLQRFATPGLQWIATSESPASTWTRCLRMDQ